LISPLENSVKAIKSDLEEDNRLMKEEIIQSISNSINRGIFQLGEQMSLQMAAQDGWIVNQIATPIETLDKAVIINNQIGFQIMDMMQSQASVTISEIKESCKDIKDYVMPPMIAVNERFWKH
jgi:hypothetical protein